MSWNQEGAPMYLVSTETIQLQPLMEVLFSLNWYEREKKRRCIHFGTGLVEERQTDSVHPAPRISLLNARDLPPEIRASSPILSLKRPRLIPSAE